MHGLRAARRGVHPVRPRVVQGRVPPDVRHHAVSSHLIIASCHHGCHHGCNRIMSSPLIMLVISRRLCPARCAYVADLYMRASLQVLPPCTFHPRSSTQNKPGRRRGAWARVTVARMLTLVTSNLFETYGSTDLFSTLFCCAGHTTVQDTGAVS